MKKVELIKSISRQTGHTQRVVGEVLSAIDLTISINAASGEDTGLGFMTVSTIARPARAARNPITGALVAVPAKNVIKIKVSKSLKDAANGGSK